MLNTISEVLDGFRNEIGTTITVVGMSSPVPVKYGRKSARGRVEKDSESYPVVIISDQTPEFDSTYQDPGNKLVDDYLNFDADTGYYDNAYLYNEPRRIIFRFDVTAFVKSPLDKLFVYDYFMSKYADNGLFIANKVSTPEGDVGDVVPYTVLNRENVRTDGVHEINFEFTLKPFVALKGGTLVDLITEFNLSLLLEVEVPPVVPTVGDGMLLGTGGGFLLLSSSGEKLLLG